MRTEPLHPRFGVEVLDVDLTALDGNSDFSEIRRLFENHSLLLFRNQSLSAQDQQTLAMRFGPLEDRDADVAGTAPRERPPVPVLTNESDNGDGVDAADSLRVLNLMANQYWHTDSTFLRTPALINAITAYKVPSSGGQTEIVSTRAAWEDLPPDLKEKAEETVFLHSVLPSRKDTDERLLELPEVKRYQGQAWRAVWPNPVTGDKALYIANHIYGARNMDWEAARAFAEELIAFSTQPERIYTHDWRAGDVLIWDERATMHRVRPWPFAEARTLASICVSARPCDGLEAVAPSDGPIRTDEVLQAA